MDEALKEEIKGVGKKIMNSALHSNEQIRLLGNIGNALKSGKSIDVKKAILEAERASSVANQMRQHGNINMKFAQVEDAVKKSLEKGEITDVTANRMLADIRIIKKPKTAAESMMGRKVLYDAGIFKRKIGLKPRIAKRITGSKRGA